MLIVVDVYPNHVLRLSKVLHFIVTTLHGLFVGFRCVQVRSQLQISIDSSHEDLRHGRSRFLWLACGGTGGVNTSLLQLFFRYQGLQIEQLVVYYAHHDLQIEQLA